MQVGGESTAHVVCGAPGSGVGWIYLQPMQVTLQQSPVTRFTHYLHKQSIGLGAAQVLLGGLCIVFNAISLAVGTTHGISFVGHGFWCGALFIVTGAIGISAGVSKTKCKVVSFMVLCIISASFTVGILSCGVLSTVLIGYHDNDLNRCQGYGYGASYSYYYCPPCSIYSTAIAMEGCMAVCSFIAAIFFIWGSVLCCKAIPCGCCRCCCCCCYTLNSIQQVLHPQNYAANIDPQMIQSAKCSLPTIPCQPGAPPAYQPCLTQCLWMQSQMMQGTVATAAAAAAAGPSSPQNPPIQAVERSSGPQVLSDSLSEEEEEDNFG